MLFILMSTVLFWLWFLWKYEEFFLSLCYSLLVAFVYYYFSFGFLFGISVFVIAFASLIIYSGNGGFYVFFIYLI